jgi:septum formation protein
MKITDYKVLLASNSPRREELLRGIDIDFEIKVLPDIDESYPTNLPNEEVAEYVALKKANSYTNRLKEDELMITADTVVLLDNKIYGKPTNKEEAKEMLQNLSGKTHRVISGVCLTSTAKQTSFSVASDVEFSTLTKQEIEYYINRYAPFDKAGSYGVQEWIGYIGVKHISGSYFNIMGLPIQRLYRELLSF